MNPEFQLRVETYLNDFRVWSHNHTFEKCRLVQYSGFEFTGAIDVPLDEVEQEIRGCLAEAFQVAWNEENGRLYLVVRESLPSCPDWRFVFQEEDLMP